MRDEVERDYIIVVLALDQKCPQQEGSVVRRVRPREKGSFLDHEQHNADE